MKEIERRYEGIGLAPLPSGASSTQCQSTGRSLSARISWIDSTGKLHFRFRGYRRQYGRATVRRRIAVVQAQMRHVVVGRQGECFACGLRGFVITMGFQPPACKCTERRSSRLRAPSDPG